MSCVDDREIDEQTGRCLKCGHQCQKAKAEPIAARNAGAPARSPSQAYRAPAQPPSAFNDATRELEYERRRGRGEHALSVAQTTSAADVAAVKRIYPELDPPFDPAKTVAATNGLQPADAAIAAEPAIVAVPSEQHAGPETARLLPASSPPDLIPPAAPAPAPSSTPSAQWLAETRALAEGFLALATTADQRAADATAQAAKFTAEAKQLRKSAAVFTALLDQVGLLAFVTAESDPPAPVAETASPESSAAPDHDKAWRIPAGHWAVRHDACIDCGTTERPHIANGRCRPCDSAWRTKKARG